MVKVDGRLAQPEPAVSTFAATDNVDLLGVVRAHVRSSAGQVAAVEIPDLLPAVVSGFWPVCNSVDREKCVPGAFVGVKLVFLACLVERFGQLGRLFGCRKLVVSAKQTQQRARQVLSQVNDWSCFQRHAFWRRVDDERSVAVDRGVELQATSSKEGLPSARAITDDANFAVGARQRTQVIGGPGYIADEALIWHTTLCPCSCRCIIWTGSWCIAVVEVRHQRCIAIRSELPDDLFS